MSSADSPCAACKFLGRKCTQECVFAPYFPPDEPLKFATIHKIFGARHVEKILNQFSTSQREVVVASLYYQAECRLRDPVYGSVGLISSLQRRVEQAETDLYNVKKQLATYIGSSAPMPIASPSTIYNDMSPMMGIQDAGSRPGPYLAGGPSMRIILRKAQQQQPWQRPSSEHAIEQQQQLVMAMREQLGKRLRSNWDEQQQQVQFQTVDGAATSRYEEAAGGTTGGGFSQRGPTSGETSSSLALGDTSFLHNAYHHQTQHHQQENDEQLETPFQRLTVSSEGHGEMDSQTNPQHQQQQQQQQQQGSTSHSHQYQHFHNHHHDQQHEYSGSEGWDYDPTCYFERREMF